MVDTPSQQFRVSEGKTAKVQVVLQELMTAETVTPRLLARAAGKIIALGPAVLPASLFSRPLFQAMKGKLLWD